MLCLLSLLASFEACISTSSLLLAVINWFSWISSHRSALSTSCSRECQHNISNMWRNFKISRKHWRKPSKMRMKVQPKEKHDEQRNLIQKREIGHQGLNMKLAQLTERRVGNSTTSVQCKPPYVWTDMVQGCRSTVWCRRLVLPYGTKGGQFVLQFDLSTAGRGSPKKSPIV